MDTFTQSLNKPVLHAIDHPSLPLWDTHAVDLSENIKVKLNIKVLSLAYANVDLNPHWL